MTMITGAPKDGSALTVAELEQDLDHRFAGLRRLLEVTDRINPCVLLDEAFRQIHDLCKVYLPYDRLEFALLEDSGETLSRRWLHWPHSPESSNNLDNPACNEQLRGSLLSQVMDHGRPEIIHDLASLPGSTVSSTLLRMAAAQGMRSALAAPLTCAGKAVGFVIFTNSKREAYLAQHAGWLETIIGQLSSLIAKGRLYEMVIQAQLDSERLLRNMLPDAIVKRLKAGEQVIADGIPEATVVFVDIVNFVRLSASMSPSAVIIVLNRIFSAFDALCEQYGVEKIKTIGDAYMLATGVPKPFPEHVVVAARIALDMQELGKRLGMREERSLLFRIGIHTGPVVAGVIGTRKFSYDLWGDTVNIASRMEAHGIPGRIHVSQAVYEKLKDDFDFEARGLVDIKGMGRMETFFLDGPKSGSTYRSVVWSMLNRTIPEEEQKRRSQDD